MRAPEQKAAQRGQPLAPKSTETNVKNESPRFRRKSLRIPIHTVALALLHLALPLFIVFWGQTPSHAQPATSVVSSDKTEFFEKKIRPVLAEHCYSCHNSQGNAESGVIVDHRDAIRSDGLIVPGKPSESHLLAVIKHQETGLEMPQDGPKLNDAVIRDFEHWIATGATDPRDQPPTHEELAHSTSWQTTLQRRKTWWSFLPIQEVALPANPHPQKRADSLPSTTPNVSEHIISKHPVDRFIDKKLHQHGLTRSKPASVHSLIRRAYLTLLGLPPTPDELQLWSTRFRASKHRSDTVEALIDDLLANPHFGERWARHWMDWIRYAETHGSEGDPVINNAWLYRDYLIRALNDDIPYDQLILEHIAGDILEQPRINEKLSINESLIGTAHWRMVFHGFAPTDALDEKVRFVDDQVNAFSKAFLGMTISCARCHNHKFDAISQEDYYAIFGILASCRPGRREIDVPDLQRQQSSDLSQLKQRIRSQIASEWLSSIDQVKQRLTKAEFSWPENNADAKLLLAPFIQSAPTTTSPSQTTPQGRQWNETLQTLTQICDANQRSTADQATADHQNSPTKSSRKHWDFSNPEDVQEWYQTGIGLENQKNDPNHAGQFIVSLDGETAIREILPHGLYSHLISDKHAARFTSPDFTAKPNQEVWLRVRGGGESTTRYVVQDYPRNGTVYPVSNLTEQWKWQRFDLSYWQGDSMHLELTTARDAPLLVRNSERSWFGITDVVLQPTGSPPKSPRLTAAKRIIEAAQERPTPNTIEKISDLYVEALTESIRRWSTSSQCVDADSDLIETFIQCGLLTNQLNLLPSTKILVDQYREIHNQIKTATRIPTLEETKGRTQPLFIRGDHRKQGDIIPARFLEAIDDNEYIPEIPARLQLAEDLIRDDNPLTRRVIVNRLWHHLFGKGIVSTPDNFGRMGTQPTHPELLDWLANQLKKEQWSLKSIIKMIVTSETWQQDSTPSERSKLSDPANQWLSHCNLRRLEAEAIRDSLLATSGRLNLDLYGPPIGSEANRRSIYVRVIRNSLDPFLRAFDFPEPFSATGRRDVTNVPAQSLTLLNDPLVITSAESLASRLSMIDESRITQDPKELQVQLGFHLLLGREPNETETKQSLDYIQELIRSYRSEEERREQLEDERERNQQDIKKIYNAAKQRIEVDSEKTTTITPQPIASWDFAENLDDQIGSLHGQAHGDAKVANGKLILSNGGYVTTPPINREIKAKTLEAWLQLDNLSQKGGGAISIQTLDGGIFDSIVFAELQNKKWISGSNFHQRTQSVSGVEETEADRRFVHLAITYAEDGTITLFREGEAYGESYRRNDLISFQANQSIISFGVRHLPAGGNRLLSAKIDRAAIYDYALSAQEINDTFIAAGGGVNTRQLKAIMSETELHRITQLESAQQNILASLNNLGPKPSNPNQAAMKDFCQALYLLKEFIFIP